MIRKNISLMMLIVLTIVLGKVSLDTTLIDYKLSNIDKETVVRVIDSIYDGLKTLDEYATW